MPNLQVPVTDTEVIELASKGLVCREIAARLNISESTVNHKFARALKNGRALRDAALRHKQFDRAMAGSDTMLIWLGKQYLEQSDHTEITGQNRGPLEVKLILEAVPTRNLKQLPDASV